MWTIWHIWTTQSANILQKKEIHEELITAIM
jgi:hypothetical protein